MGRRRERTRTDVFAGVAFFEGCDRRLLAEMAPHADRVRLPAGAVLAAAGRHAWQLLVLTEGLARPTADGRQGTLVAGQAVAPGAAAAIAPYPATVTALTAVEVLVVNGPAFAWAVRQQPSLVTPPPRTARAAATAPAGAAGTTRAARLARAWRRAFPARPTPTVHDRNSNVIAGVGR
jgi:hypothetical protein